MSSPARRIATRSPPSTSSTTKVHRSAPVPAAAAIAILATLNVEVTKQPPQAEMSSTSRSNSPAKKTAAGSARYPGPAWSYGLRPHPQASPGLRRGSRVASNRGSSGARRGCSRSNDRFLRGVASQRRLGSPGRAGPFSLPSNFESIVSTPASYVPTFRHGPPEIKTASSPVAWATSRARL